VKPLKTLSLAALAALMAMAFIGASSAMAEQTGLCRTDGESCEAVTHVHETSVTDALLLNSVGNVKCAVLFLSTSVGTAAAPLVIKGNFTYSGCFRKKIFGGEEACTVTEKNGPVEIKVLKTSHETGEVTGKGEVEVKCGTVIECVYNGEGLKGTAKGPLLSTQANGEVTLSEQTTHVVSGAFCPETAKLDITTTPLSATYLKSGLHYCVEYPVAGGLYLDSTCTTKDATRAGKFALVIGPVGKNVGETLCVDLYEKVGLWKNSACTEDLGSSLYEKGIIKTVK